MIHKIWANNKKFKPVEFSSGLNIILAERSLESGQKDTRNGAGKTTLLNIVHFCLGANLQSSNLPKDNLQDWEFYINIDIAGQNVIAKRSIANSNIIETDKLLPGSPSNVCEYLEGMWIYKNDEWKDILGLHLFNLKNISTKYSPSFRGLVSYFIRRKTEAYVDPFIYFRSQKTFDVQINNAFLLGLNWIYASEAQEIRDKEIATKALSAAITANISATQGELEADRMRIEQELRLETEAIKVFRVHPIYSELEERANQLTKDIHIFSNKAILLKRKLDRYEISVSEEKTQDIQSVEKLFFEAGILFPENIKKSLDAVKDFHRTIVKNRKLFLEAEIVQIRNEYLICEDNIKQLSDERADLLQLLETHGALEELSLLQERSIEKKNLLETIKNKITNIKEIGWAKKEIKTARIELEADLQRDYEQNRSEWEKAVSLFNENSQALYDKPGNLIINTTDNGYKFDIEIQKSGSEGIEKMKIFCYDLMLIELMSKRRGINFLFHDSTIFDGVDSRQKALALMFANKKALEHGFQYICTLNSDTIPHNDFTEEFKIDDYIRLTLKDQSPDDSLLGFHFGLTKKKKRG